MSYGIFQQQDIDELSKEYRDALTGFNSGTIYYPSRIKYLSAIQSTLESLLPTKRYLILALNSTVSPQRLWDNDTEYHFGQYMAAFRKRADIGDVVVRIFCLDGKQTNTGAQTFHIHKRSCNLMPERLLTKVCV